VITQNIFTRWAVKLLILRNRLYIFEQTNTLMKEQYVGDHAVVFEMTHETQSRVKCARTRQNK
jgi:hypothetical protein